MRAQLTNIAVTLLKKSLLYTNYSRSVIDQLKLISASEKECFSEQFNDVLKTYENTYPHLSESERFDYTNRLSEIIELELAISKIQETSNATGTDLLPMFELTESDQVRVALLCSQMRKIVSGATVFDNPHKVRLLDRIAAIEVEVLKPKGLFDVVRGGMTDLGETLGIFGHDIKPLTDRMREVVGIARRNTKDYDKLPAPEETLSLPAPDEDSSDD